MDYLANDIGLDKNYFLKKNTGQKDTDYHLLVLQ